jgi:acyl-CoA synthetase (NDP forming)
MDGKELDFFFNPRSIAVVGASDKPGKLSSTIIDSLLGSGYQGRIYPVNPKYQTIRSIKCYPSIIDIEGGVDLAVFAVPAPVVPGLLNQAREKLKGAIVVSGGFGEAGEAGRRLEDEIKEIVNSGGPRVIGPNCMGIYDAISKVDTFFISNERVKRPIRGSISILSQSGSFALTAMDELATEGIGVARLVSYGNKVDVNESDCLDFLAGDETTKAVVLYIEAIDDGRRFVESASKCAAKKPVMALKVGRHGEGASAALSHTGAIAGRYELYKAAFKKASVIELEGYEDIIDGCRALSMQDMAKGSRVLIITDGGGVGVAIADACTSSGLIVDSLPEEKKKALKAAFPPFFTISNPMDLTGSVTDELFAEALERTMEGNYFDMAIVVPLWGPPNLTDRLPELIGQKAVRIGKPVLICTPGGEYTRGKKRLFEDWRLPVFSTPEGVVRAASVLAGKGRAKRSHFT